MIHICSFSSGASSAVMTERVLEKHGAENVIIVFMDTTMEHQDNYRFMDELEKRWIEVYGAEKIVRISKNLSPYELADRKKMVFNTKIAPCTRMLKIEPFMEWLGNLGVEKQELTIHIGIDYEEVHRTKSIKKNYNNAGYKVDFPLLWRPLEYRSYPDVCLYDFGIKPPITYSMGFSHANCLGTDKKGRSGCVKLGIKERILHYKVFPEAAEATSAWEYNTEAHQKGGHAMLRRVSGGETNYIPLKQIYDDYKSSLLGQQSLFGNIDDVPACFHCGIGDFISPTNSDTSE